MNNLTWECEICKKVRPDNCISVITYPLKNIKYVERNLKYCNDNIDCVEKANKKADAGKF